jgi:secondary thiamine-phosphate synthase enzyme
MPLQRLSEWARQDSNLGPTDYESAALTAELRARNLQSTAKIPAFRGDSTNVPGLLEYGAGWRTGRGEVGLKVLQLERSLRTRGGLEIRDITDEVRECVAESGVRDGIACVYSPHTTCCVRVNEFETGFLEDFIRMLRRLVPSQKYYAHDDWDRRTENICPEDMEFGNGHSHCMAMLLGPAGESIPVRDGELCLGTWQRVLFMELDRSRDRRWIVQVVGD